MEEEGNGEVLRLCINHIWHCFSPCSTTSHFNHPIILPHHEVEIKMPVEECQLSCRFNYREGFELIWNFQ